MKSYCILLLCLFSVVAFGQTFTDSVGIDEVVVYGTRSNTLLKNSTQLIQVMNNHEIQKLRAASFGDLLGATQGLSIEGGTGSGFPQRSIINMNGLPANYNLVLLDGKRLLTDHIHTGQNVDFIPIDFVEQIEFIRGAGSSQFGSDALGGIINIITRSCKDRPEYQASFSRGSFNSTNAGISILTPINKELKVSSYVGWEESDGAPIKAPASRIGVRGYEKMTSMNTMDFTIGKYLQARAQVNYMRNKMDWKENNVLVDKYGFLFMPSVQLKANVAKNLSITTNVNYSHWESQQNLEKNRYFQPEFFINYDGFVKHSLVAGADYRQNFFERTKVAAHQNFIAGVFIQDEYQLSEKFNAMIALRADKAQGIDIVVSPKASVLYKPSRFLSIRGSAGRGFHAPLLFELYEVAYGHSGTALRFGNENLIPEYSSNYSLTLELFPVRNLTVMVNTFYNNIENMIVPVYKGAWDVDPTKDVWMRENISQADVYGFESSAKYAINKNYSVEMGYQISENRDRTTARQLPYNPGSAAYGKCFFSQKITKDLSVDGFVTFKAVMGRSAWNWKPASTESRDFQEGLITILKDYQKLDAGISLVVRKNYSFYFNAYNLLQNDIETLDDAYTVYEGVVNFRGGFRMNF